MPDTTETLVEYKTRALRALTAAGKTAQLRGSDYARTAGRLGLPTDFSVSGDDVTIPQVTEDPTIKGLPRTSFTAEALAELDAQSLAAFRDNLYREIRYNAKRGYVDADVAVAVLTEMGLPVPTTVSHVSAEVEGVGYVSFTVEGEITREQVIERLAPHAVTPVRDAIMAAFPEATGMRQPVSDVYIEKARDWPESA